LLPYTATLNDSRKLNDKWTVCSLSNRHPCARRRSGFDAPINLRCRFNHSDQLRTLVPVRLRESDEFVHLRHHGASLWRAHDRYASAAAELKQPLLAKHP